MSKIEYFHYVKNKIDKLSHLACIQYENRNAMAYDCCDVAIILRKLKFIKSQSTNTFHYERKKVFEPMFVLESKSQDKIKSWSLSLWQRLLRLHDVIDFWRKWPFIS